jgi:hypothetical protein
MICESSHACLYSIADKAMSPARSRALIHDVVRQLRLAGRIRAALRFIQPFQLLSKPIPSLNETGLGFLELLKKFAGKCDVTTTR